jgi:hypothetical protein
MLSVLLRERALFVDDVFGGLAEEPALNLIPQPATQIALTLSSRCNLCPTTHTCRVPSAERNATSLSAAAEVPVTNRIQWPHVPNDRSAGPTNADSNQLHLAKE